MTPPSDRPPTLARELSARAQAFEHALEEVVGERLEHGLQVAEESIARRYGAHALRSVRLAVRVLGWLQRFGARACLLSWLPGVGDPLCAVAGWLRLPFWPCVAYMAIGKFARYVTMTALLLWAFPGTLSLP